MVRSRLAISVLGALGALVLGLGCQGNGAGNAGTGSASGAPTITDAAALADAAEAVAVPASDAGDADARGKQVDPDPEPPDPGRMIADLGAISAWQAVVDRAQLLGRRGQHGVVYGRVGPVVMVPAPVAPATPAAATPAGATPATPNGATPAPALPTAGAGSAANAHVGAGAGTTAMLPGAGSDSAHGAGSARPSGAGSAQPIANAAPGAGSAAKPAVAAPASAGLVASPYVWLIDDTEGNGSLAIRIALGDRAKLGDRIAAGGAWQLDRDRRWYWKPDSVQPLPPAPASELKEPPPALPGHAIANGDLASGARTMSLGRDGDVVYFQIVGPVPAADGDGWLVADQLGSPAAALMNLPGERTSYGGQDMRAPDERWQLKRGQTYWVRIGKLRKRGADKPPVVNARTAPVRVL